MKISKEKKTGQNDFFLKACSFCAYQERTQREVRDRLYELGVDKDEAEEIIVKLITENFLNEERFAKAFAGGKFRIKKWGRNKINQALKERGVSSYCIKKGLEEIDEESYIETLKSLLVKKEGEIKEENIFKRKDKISKYLIAKGFEPELVWDILKNNQ